SVWTSDTMVQLLDAFHPQTPIYNRSLVEATSLGMGEQRLLSALTGTDTLSVAGTTRNLSCVSLPVMGKKDFCLPSLKKPTQIHSTFWHHLSLEHLIQIHDTKQKPSSTPTFMEQELLRSQPNLDEASPTLKTFTRTTKTP